MNAPDRWYVVNKNGVTAVCATPEAAEAALEVAQRDAPDLGPYIITRLAASFAVNAAKMAGSSVQGEARAIKWPPRAMRGDNGVTLRDGREFLPLNAVECLMIDEAGTWNRCLDECQRAYKEATQPAPAAEQFGALIAAQTPLPPEIAKYVSKHWHEYADESPATQPEARGVVTEDMVRQALHFCPSDLSAPGKWKWIAARLNDAAAAPAPVQADCLALLPWSDFWARRGRRDVSHDFNTFQLAQEWATACITAATPEPVRVDEAMIERAEAYMLRVLPNKSTACLGGKFNFYELLTAALADAKPPVAP